MTQATLGLAVDSSQVEKGTISLDKLSTAARRAEGAAESLAGGNRRAASTATQVEGAVEREANALRQATAAANDNARAVQATGSVYRRAQANTANLAAQFQDVAISASMGMSPIQVALQQGSQISAVFGGMGASGALKSLGSAFASVLSPVSLATIGITAFAAVGIQMVDWTSVAQVALNGLASGLEIIGPYAAVAAGGLALFYAPTVIAGLGSAAASIKIVTSAIVGATQASIAFAAINPWGAFVIGVTAAAALTVAFRDEMASIFGVDLVGSLKSWANTAIGVFVGVYRFIVSTWERLPDALAALAKLAADRALNAVGFGGLKQEFMPSGGEMDALGAGTSAFQSALGQDYIGNIASGASDALRGLAGGIGSVTEATAAQKGQEQELNRVLAERYALIEQLQTPWQAYQETLRGINTLQQQGMLLPEQAAQLHMRAGAQITDTYLGVASQLSGTLSGAFRDNKAFAIANAIINTAQGVTQALASYPPPFSFVMAGAQAAAGAVQLATIQSQQPSGYAAGGLVTGAGSGTSDSIPAMLSNGEFVVNARAANQNRGLLESINRGGGAQGMSPGRVQVEVMVSVDDNGNLQAYVGRVATDRAAVVVAQASPGIVNQSVDQARGAASGDIARGRTDSGLGSRFALSPQAPQR